MNVQNHPPVKFFIGCSPSIASRIITSATGAMISVNQLRKRKSNFEVNDWILDSGAFTEVSKFGEHRLSPDDYVRQINRWSRCGNLLAAVSQDYMCEPFILKLTKMSVQEHQDLTIQKYDQILSLRPNTYLMPVLQGYKVSDYLAHLQSYGDRISANQWVGVGSVCKRNGDPEQILDILKAIKCLCPTLKLHGFGLKQTALENPKIRELLHSCDSMAWSYGQRFSPERDSVQNQLNLAAAYQEKIQLLNNNNSVQKRIPVTAGAGNKQGRKSKWRNPTMAIRIPKKYAEKLLDLARQWEDAE
jgi:hypothetical protein